MNPTPRWRASIGWIRPGSVDRLLDDFFRMTPPDVNLVVYTTNWSLKIVHAGAFDAAAFAAMQDEMLATVRLCLEEHRPDFLAINGDLLQSAMGPSWSRALGATVAAATGTPTITAMTALEEALASLGVRRVAMGSPFRPDQNAHVVRFLEDAGFTVTASEGCPTYSPADIRALGPETPYALGVRAFQAAPGAEVVYIPCSQWWGASAAISRLEAELGVPVVTTYSPILWKALVTLGYDAPVQGYGRLLEQYTAAPAPSAG